MTGSPQPPTISSSRRPTGQFLSGSVPTNKSASSRPDLVGQRFGWVEVISPEVLWPESRDTRGHLAGQRHLKVRCCGCGTEKLIDMRNLLLGKTNGCQPCSQPQRAPKWLLKRVTAMRSRCQNPKTVGWERYGGRGIEFRFRSVMEGAMWIQAHLGLDKTRELDRVDNNGHYEPGNLRYATRSQNSRNQARSKLTQSDAAWAETQSPLGPHATARYLRAGFPKEAIIGIAYKAVLDRRKNWRGIRDRLVSLGFMTS